MKLLVVLFHGDEYDQDHLLEEAFASRDICVGRNEARTIAFPDGQLVVIHDSETEQTSHVEPARDIRDWLQEQMAENEFAWRYVVYHRRTRRYDAKTYNSQQSMLIDAGFYPGADIYEYSHVKTDPIYRALAQLLGFGCPRLSEILTSLGPEATPIGKLVQYQAHIMEALLGIDVHLQAWQLTKYDGEYGKIIDSDLFGHIQSIVAGACYRITGDPEDPFEPSIDQLMKDVYGLQAPGEWKHLCAVASEAIDQRVPMTSVATLVSYLNAGQTGSAADLLRSQTPDPFHDWFVRLGEAMSNLLRLLSRPSTTN